MPFKQKTFHVVPNLANPIGPRPPMTSRAAKKAYKDSTRRPKVSRAEQRKLDAEEIARQKKDFEKERAAEKARVGREKKAAKEEEAKKERRRKGIPEKSRWVRPSQPYITGFVHKDAITNSKRKRDEEDDKLDIISEDEEDDNTEPPRKTVCFEGPRLDTELSYDETAELQNHSVISIVSPKIARTRDDLVDTLEASPTSAYAFVPPSTMAFLNANIDAFESDDEEGAIPSTQSVSVADDFNDFPSNTQVARELSTESRLQETSTVISLAASHDVSEVQSDQLSRNEPKSPIPSQQLPRLRITTTQHVRRPDPAFDLMWLSSQDLHISSQDLRDMDTPCKALQEIPQPSQRPRQPAKSLPKPRFFEEKEEDLLHAALQESLDELKRQRELDKQEAIVKRDALRRSRRKPLQRVLSTKSDYGDDGIDEAMLALLAEAETRP